MFYYLLDIYCRVGLAYAEHQVDNRRLDVPEWVLILVHSNLNTWLCGWLTYAEGGMRERRRLKLSLRECFGLDTSPCVAFSLYMWYWRDVWMMSLCTERCLCSWRVDSFYYLLDHLCWMFFDFGFLFFPLYFYSSPFSSVSALAFVYGIALSIDIFGPSCVFIFPAGDLCKGYSLLQVSYSEKSFLVSCHIGAVFDTYLFVLDTCLYLSYSIFFLFWFS